MIYSTVHMSLFDKIEVTSKCISTLFYLTIVVLGLGILWKFYTDMTPMKTVKGDKVKRIQSEKEWNDILKRSQVILVVLRIRQ